MCAMFSTKVRTYSYGVDRAESLQWLVSYLAGLRLWRPFVQCPVALPRLVPIHHNTHLSPFPLFFSGFPFPSSVRPSSVQALFSLLVDVVSMSCRRRTRRGPNRPANRPQQARTHTHPRQSTPDQSTRPIISREYLSFGERLTTNYNAWPNDATAAAAGSDTCSWCVL